jgi:hypothetical protein
MGAQPTLGDRDSGPPVEVRVYRFGLLKVCEWCDSEDDAAAVVAMWRGMNGTRCEVHRLLA